MCVPLLKRNGIVLYILFNNLPLFPSKYPQTPRRYTEKYKATLMLTGYMHYMDVA